MKKQITNYYRRLWGTAFAFLSFAIILHYTTTLIGLSLLLVGTFLYLENTYQWGFQFWDFWGHEWFGVILLISAMALGDSRALYALIPLIIGTIIAIDMDKEKQTWNFFPWRKK